MSITEKPHVSPQEQRAADASENQLIALFRARRITRLLRTFIFVGALLVVIGALQALLPSRVQGELSDAQLNYRAGQCGGKCDAAHQLQAGGFQYVGGETVYTIKLAAMPKSGATLVVGLPDDAQDSFILNQSAAGKWSATIYQPHHLDIAHLGVAVDGNHLILGIPGHVSSLFVIGTGVQRLPALLSTTSPQPWQGNMTVPAAPLPHNLNLVDLVLLVIVITALVVGWRSGLMHEALRLVATLVTLGLTLLLFPTVSSALSKAAGNRQAGDALTYGLLITAIAMLGMLAARAVAARMLQMQTPQALQRIDHPLATVFAGFRVIVIAAMMLAILQSLSALSWASDRITESPTGSTLAAKWDAFFPPALVKQNSNASTTPDPYAKYAAACGTIPTGTVPAYATPTQAASGQGTVPTPSSGSSLPSLPGTVPYVTTVTGAVTQFDHGAQFSLTAIIARSNIGSGQGDAPIDRMGSAQLWFFTDGTSHHKALRIWNGQSWVWQHDSDANDLRIAITDKGAYSFYWTGLAHGDTYSFVGAAPTGCASFGADASGQPAQAGNF